ncbi:hypothetical protein BC828DRAFT_380477 [Blastocladiella britannica]|nr:hypothetical protein BC828DRAFT_380477 [Blastocladiella britannica]
MTATNTSIFAILLFLLAICKFCAQAGRGQRANQRSQPSPPPTRQVRAVYFYINAEPPINSCLDRSNHHAPMMGGGQRPHPCQRQRQHGGMRVVQSLRSHQFQRQGGGQRQCPCSGPRLCWCGHKYCDYFKISDPRSKKTTNTSWTMSLSRRHHTRPHHAMIPIQRELHSRPRKVRVLQCRPLQAVITMHPRRHWTHRLPSKQKKTTIVTCSKDCIRK